jgi:hypothetical protein
LRYLWGIFIFAEHGEALLDNTLHLSCAVSLFRRYRPISHDGLPFQRD